MDKGYKELVKIVSGLGREFAVVLFDNHPMSMSEYTSAFVS
jgi:hypothetical protein